MDLKQALLSLRQLCALHTRRRKVFMCFILVTHDTSVRLNIHQAPPPVTLRSDRPPQESPSSHTLKDNSSVKVSLDETCILASTGTWWKVSAAVTHLKLIGTLSVCLSTALQLNLQVKSVFLHRLKGVNVKFSCCITLY